MRWIVVIFFLLFSVAAYAEGVDLAVNGKQDLEYTLNTLKESVARLSAENKQMAATNDQVRNQLRVLSDQLKSEQSRAGAIESQRQGIEPKYNRRLAEKAALEDQFKAAEDLSRAFRADRASAESALGLKQTEDDVLAGQMDALSREIADIDAGLMPGQDRSAELDSLRMEQGSLQKELDASLVELDRAKSEWKEFSVAVNAGPGQVDILTKEQASIKNDLAVRAKEIEARRMELTAALKQVEDSLVVYSAANMAKLEQEVQALDEQVRGIEKENADLDKSFKPDVSKPSPQANRKKEEARFKALVEQNRLLIIELDKLQQTMIFMDKKKTEIEKAVTQSGAN